MVWARIRLYGLSVLANRHEVRAPLIAFPSEWCLHSRPGHKGLFKKVDAQRDDIELHRGVIWLASWVAKWEVDKHESRHANLFDDVAGAADDHGGNASFFEVSSDQTDRLMAYRSKRNQHHNVDIVFSAPGEHTFGVFDGLALAVRSGDAVEAFGQRPNTPAVSEGF